MSAYGSAAYPVNPEAPALPVLRRISWGAILAGTLIAVATGATLNLLGLAIGLTTVDATSGDTPSMASLGIAGSLWVLVTNLVGLALGGYAAARLSGNRDRGDAALHGAAVWATGYLVTALLVGSAVSGAAGATTNALSNAIGGLGRGAGQAAQAAAPSIDPEQAINRARIALSGPSDPVRMTPEQRGAEIAELVGKRVASSNFSNEDRARLNRLVAAEAGITEAEANTRIQSFEAETRRVAEETEQRAREAADEAAKAAATTAFWVFAALLLGALAAILGARAGARGVAPTRVV